MVSFCGIDGNARENRTKRSGLHYHSGLCYRAVSFRGIDGKARENREKRNRAQDYVVEWLAFAVYTVLLDSIVHH